MKSAYTKKNAGDLTATPPRAPATSVTPFLTPPRNTQTADLERRCWTVDSKGQTCGRQLLFREPPPLVPNMEEQLAKDLNCLKGLIAGYANNSSSNANRDRLNTNKKKLDSEIAKIIIQIIMLNPESIREQTISDNRQHAIKCLNNNSSFLQRLKIIARITGVGNISKGELSNWCTLKDFDKIMSQLVFEANLKALNIQFTPLKFMKLESEKRTRIIFSDIEKSNSGFDYLLYWLKHCSDSYLGIRASDILNEAGPKKIISDMDKKGIKYVNFEIAWGHIVNNGRHFDERVVFVSSLESLKIALELCSTGSTLVLDAHGSCNKLIIGKTILQGKELRKYIENLIGLLNENIEHVILSVCATGFLTYDTAISEQHGAFFSRNKYCMDSAETDFFARHKNRKKIFVNQGEPNILSMFEKLPDNIDSLAAYFAQLLLTRRNQNPNSGTAVSVSPSILYPDNINGGVISVPASVSNRKEWPDYHESWESDERGLRLPQFAFKTITLYNHPDNRKALPPNGAWKKLSAT